MTKALIRYYIDYNVKENKDREKTTYQITANGTRVFYEVLVSFGESIEFLMTEVYDRLEKVRNAVPAGWNGEQRFNELEKNLRGDALTHFEDLVRRNYPDAADKTDVAYVEIKALLITALSDHTSPGDEIHTYLSSHLAYMRCKMQDGSGRIEKPTKVLSRMQRIAV